MKKRAKPADIKRENINGKYYVVLREHGNEVERRLWAYGESRKRPEGVTTFGAKANFKKSNSIYDDRRRITGDSWKVIEETRFSTVQANKKSDVVPKIKRIRGEPFRYFVRGYIEFPSGKNIEIIASSRSDTWSSVKDARDDAWKKFYERVHGAYTNDPRNKYDEGEGIKIVEDGHVRILEEGVIQYRQK